MVGFELLFAKHAADITHLLGGRAYTIHRLRENEIEAEPVQGNIVSLIVARGGRAEISMGSLFEPVEECPRLNALLESLRLLRDRTRDRRQDSSFAPAALFFDTRAQGPTN